MSRFAAIFLHNNGRIAAAQILVRISIKLLVVLIAANSIVNGATINVPSMSQTDMQSAAASAHDGDVFLFPAGTEIYSSPIVWTNAVTLKFVPGQSIVNCSLPSTAYLITFAASSGTKPVRITGLSVNGRGNGGGLAFWNSESTAIRVDHCSFTDCGYTGVQNGYGKAVLFRGYRVYGVIDHCNFTNNSTHFEYDGNDSQSWPPHEAMGLGTTNCVVLEDNYFFDSDARTSTSDQHFYVSNGGRVCFRHNTVKITGTRADAFWDSHGNNNLLPNDSRGTVYTVIENNNLDIHSANNGGKEFYIRGGCFIMISNIINTVAPYEVVLTDEECWYHSAGLPNFPRDYPSWPRQDQITNSWIVGNVRNGAPMTSDDVFLFDGGIGNGYVQNVIQEGREYFVTNGLPPLKNYSPLIYPHPLVTGAPVTDPPVCLAHATSSGNPLTISFSSAGSFAPRGVPLTYFWTFGDGQASTDPHPLHKYPLATNYTARLSVSDGLRTASTKLNVTVSP